MISNERNIAKEEKKTNLENPHKMNDTRYYTNTCFGGNEYCCYAGYTSDNMTGT